MVSTEDLASIFDQTTKKLVELAFTDFVLSITQRERSQLRFADSQFTVAKNWASISLDIFAVRHNKTVAISLDDLNPQTIEQTINSLDVLAKALPSNPNYLGISEGPFSYPVIDRLLDSAFDDFTDKAVDLVQSAINAAEAEGAKRSAGVLYWQRDHRFLTSSNGANGSFKSSSYEFTIRSFVDATSSGQGVTVGRMSSSLDFERAGREAGNIAKMAVGGTNGKPGKYNVILSPTVAADIIAATPGAANPFYMEIGFSWLKDKLGEQIGPEFVTVYDDALLPNGLGSRPFDDEGHPTGSNILIENGVLKGLIHNTSTAKRSGTTSTGNAGIIVPENTNIFFEPGDHSFDELMELCKGKPTLYITSNWYTRFTSYVDGIFSTIPRDGMFLIENGEISKPVRELRISDTMPNIFKNIKALGRDVRQIKWWEVYTPTFIPAVLIEDVNITAATS